MLGATSDPELEPATSAAAGEEVVVSEEAAAFLVRRRAADIVEVIEMPPPADMIEGPTQALRENSPERLRTELLRMLVAYDAEEQEPDIRDILWSLAPYHDCSRRLGLDPADFFDQVADAGPSRLRKVVRDFGRRTDTSPEAFGGYLVVETPKGPSYIWSY